MKIKSRRDSPLANPLSSGREGEQELSAGDRMAPGSRYFEDFCAGSSRCKRGIWRMLGIQGRGSCHSLSCLFGFGQRSFEWWVVDAELAKEKYEAYGKGVGGRRGVSRCKWHDWRLFISREAQSFKARLKMGCLRWFGRGHHFEGKGVGE